MAPLDAHLLEREDDLRDAAALLAAAKDGGGGALLIEGPAGIGKSALIRALRERAPGLGFTVLAARGAELERDFSFGVVRQLFEPALAAVTDREREALLAGAAGLAEPAVGKLDGGLASAPSSASPSLDPSFAVLHGLFWLTSNLAERTPLLIAVDDAHWADAASLRFLVYLAGRLEGLPAMLTIGLRRFEPGARGELIAVAVAPPPSTASGCGSGRTGRIAAGHGTSTSRSRPPPRRARRTCAARRSRCAWPRRSRRAPPGRCRSRSRCEDASRTTASATPAAWRYSATWCRC